MNAKHYHITLAEVAYDPEMMVIDQVRADVFDQCMDMVVRAQFDIAGGNLDRIRAGLRDVLQMGRPRTLMIDDEPFAIISGPPLSVKWTPLFKLNNMEAERSVRARAVWAGYDLSALPMAKRAKPDV